MKLINRVGERYERLQVIDRAPNKSPSDTNARWRCLCDCGRTVIAYGQDLAREKHKSCGCLNASRITKHGMAHNPVYRVWIEMRRRCQVPSHPSFHNYGGRGICVDPRWEDFSNFYADMGQRPNGGSIERIDNSGPYSKENCKWASNKEQHNNKRTNRLLTAFGRTQTVAQWSAEFGIPWTTIRSRIERYNWPVESAVSAPRQAGVKLRS